MSADSRRVASPSGTGGTARKVRTRVSFVVEIDAEAWREDYDADEVIEDVKSYLTDVVDDFLRQREVGKVVERPR